MANHIAILTHNGRATLPWNLDNPAFWDTVADCHVLILNQGSTDGTWAYLHMQAEEHPNLTVVTSPYNRSIVDGRQRLLDLLRPNLKAGDFVVMLDHDTRMTDESWLTRLLEPFQNMQVGIVGSYSPIEIAVGREGGWHMVMPQLPGVVDAVAACVTAYRADLFLDSTKPLEFDPIYAPMWHEDADLCFQARALGYLTWGLPDVGMFHAIGHKNQDLIWHRNWEFLQRKWRDKKLLKVEQ